MAKTAYAHLQELLLDRRARAVQAGGIGGLAVPNQVTCTRGGRRRPAAYSRGGVIRRWQTLLVAASAVLSSAPAAADSLFRLTEIAVEQEVSPQKPKHRVRWEGDYYVSDAGVTSTGWGNKGTKRAISFGLPHAGVTPQGSPYTSTYTRLTDGLIVRIEYESFTLERTIGQTDQRTCTDRVHVALKPGHALFEAHRLSNHEKMLESSFTYVLMKCEVPLLVG